MINWLMKTVLVSFLKKAGTLNFLIGYKTYILCLGAIVISAVGLVGGATIGPLAIPPMETKEAVGVAWAALTAITIRKSLPKKRKEEPEPTTPEIPGPPLVTG